VAQGGQDTDRQWTLIESRHEKTFIEMGLNLKDLISVYDMFHGVILGQSCTPIRCIDLEVSCGIGDNKRREVLTFEVASFNIG
jgi:hypothetical protein